MTARTIVALVTPLTPAGEVCQRSLAALADHLGDAVDTLVPALTTGEGWLLDDEHWADVVRGTIGCRSGRRVWAGALGASSTQIIGRVRHAERLGADAVVVSGHPEQGRSSGEVADHMDMVLTATGLHVVLYHERERCGTALDVDLLAELGRRPQVLAVKESHSDPAVLREVRAAVTDADVLVGREEQLATAEGADGSLTALANVDPLLCARALGNPGAAGDVAAAIERFGLARADWCASIKRELVR
ncbi:MAG TPA: dihydrodipicolinate synthase family protein, partial [Candidatus Limnocylindria bacterium]